jgi:hypothetical protein
MPRNVPRRFVRLIHGFEAQLDCLRHSLSCVRYSAAEACQLRRRHRSPLWSRHSQGRPRWFPSRNASSLERGQRHQDAAAALITLSLGFPFGVSLRAALAGRLSRRAGVTKEWTIMGGRSSACPKDPGWIPMRRPVGTHRARRPGACDRNYGDRLAESTGARRYPTTTIRCCLAACISRTS